MNDSPRIPEATELVYVPEPSWMPLFAGAGIGGVVIGLFAGLVWAILGAILLIATLVSWVRRVGQEVSRMPRSQRVSSAVIPAIPPRARD